MVMKLVMNGDENFIH